MPQSYPSEYLTKVVRGDGAGADKIRLGYWNIRGLGQNIRLVLEYLDIPYTDERYDIVPTIGEDGAKTYGGASYKPWMAAKKDLFEDVDFVMNLPYLRDETAGVTLIQTRAILQYIEQQYGRQLLACADGKDAVKRGRMLMALENCFDCNDSMVRFMYNFGGTGEAGFPELLEKWVVANLKRTIDCLPKCVPNGYMFDGERPSIADFVAYELFSKTDRVLAHMEKIGKASDSLKEHRKELMGCDKVQDIMKRFEGTDKIHRYLKLDDTIKEQINNYVGHYGGAFAF